MVIFKILFLSESSLYDLTNLWLKLSGSEIYTEGFFLIFSSIILQNRLITICLSCSVKLSMYTFMLTIAEGEVISGTLLVKIF